MNVISVAMEKGGVGKTASSLMIADYLNRAGKRVLLIDMDQQANATTCLVPDYDEELLSDALEQRLPLPILSTSWGFDVSPGDMSTAISLQKVRSKLSRLKICMGLASVEDKYDFVLIDTSPTYGDAVSSALIASDWVLVPFMPGLFEFKGLERMLLTIKEIQDDNPDLRLLGIIPTLCEKQTLITKEYLENMEAYGDLVFDVVYRRTQLQQAIEQHISIEEYQNTNPTAVAYRKITQTIIERVQ